MIPIRLFASVLAVLVVCLILSSGCTGQTGETPTPAPTLTIATTRPPTPVPVTTTPVQTATRTSAVTPVVTPAWTPGSVVQTGSAILIQGDILGYKSNQGNFFDEIRFTVALAPRAEPVTFEIPNTQIVFTKTGNPQYAVNYLILSGDENRNGILEKGESFLVSIPFTSDASQYAIYNGQKFTMAIKNPPQPQISVTTEAPPVLTVDPTVLARAAS
ncbi:MAG: hypothetical protein LUO97_03170 [Methanomicrobiales archaeon]|nr:hypothetical protein [Methanomicrobiales archaeon]